MIDLREVVYWVALSVRVRANGMKAHGRNSFVH